MKTSKSALSRLQRALKRLSVDSDSEDAVRFCLSLHYRRQQLPSMTRHRLNACAGLNATEAVEAEKFVIRR